jgi:hypothetical protein
LTGRAWRGAGESGLVVKTCYGRHNFRLKFRPWHYKPVTYSHFTLKSR